MRLTRKNGTAYDYLGKEGHYYWRELPSNRIVVSDESADGRFGVIGAPWATDDGLLYLDAVRLLDVPGKGDWIKLLPERGYTVPLLRPDGERSGTPASREEFFYAACLADANARVLMCLTEVG